jgi:hypothetical protein
MQQYPLQLTFKWSFSPQIVVKDQNEQLVFFIHQKLFKLKEAIGVFADEKKEQLVYQIKADRVIDFSARYNFLDTLGVSFGSVKRRGWKSIWKARYDIFDGDRVAFTITEQNPWVKVMDAIFAEIPIVGLFTGYVFNPIYQVHRGDDTGEIVMRLEKIPTFFSRIFTIKQIDQLDQKEETKVLLSLLMMLLLEKNRG